MWNGEQQGLWIKSAVAEEVEDKFYNKIFFENAKIWKFWKAILIQKVDKKFFLCTQQQVYPFYSKMQKQSRACTIKHFMTVIVVIS